MKQQLLPKQRQIDIENNTQASTEDLTLRDLTGKEIELLISYRLMTDEEKRQTLELMKQLAADRENLNTDHLKVNTKEVN